MAKQEFIQNLRLAGNLLFHRVGADHPAVNAKRIAGMLSSAALWMTPAAVRGFDPAEFPELSDAARAELERGVREFQKLAEQIPPNGPAGAELEAAALRYFTNILQVMEAYLPTSEEVSLLRGAMKKVHFPESVLTWEYEFGQDSSGDPAIWIWIVVDDAAGDDPAFTAATTQLLEKYAKPCEERVWTDGRMCVFALLLNRKHSNQSIHEPRT